MTRLFSLPWFSAVTLVFAVLGPTTARAQMVAGDSAVLASAIGEWIVTSRRNDAAAFLVVARPESRASIAWAPLIALMIDRADSTRVSRAPITHTPRVRITEVRVTSDTVFVAVTHSRCQDGPIKVVSTGLSAKFVRDGVAWMRVPPPRGEANAGAGMTCPW